jgi:hypothetical protein
MNTGDRVRYGLLSLLMLPMTAFLFLCTIPFWVLTGSFEKANSALEDSLGSRYTKPRNTVLKIALRAMVAAIVLFVGYLLIDGVGSLHRSGPDCDYDRTGAHCL